jgi:hypothetical protein
MGMDLVRGDRKVISAVSRVFRVSTILEDLVFTLVT